MFIYYNKDRRDSISIDGMSDFKNPAHNGNVKHHNQVVPLIEDEYCNEKSTPKYNTTPVSKNHSSSSSSEESSKTAQSPRSFEVHPPSPDVGSPSKS